MLKWWVLLLFLAAIAYVHLRGKVRHRWLEQLFDHSALLAPINVLMYWMSGVPRGAFVAKSAFPDLVALEKHWPEMLAEAQALVQREQIKAANNDDAGFNSFFKEGWKRFYLKWYDEPPPSAAACPRTVALLREAPSIKAALFAYLPASAKLNPHRDPYAGALRYHLGLATPNDDRCRIWVDGEPYSWRDGEGVIFDETYIHWVRNDTAKGRLILLCDLERPLRFGWARALNRAFSRHVMRAAASPNQTGDRIGVISKLFRISFVAGQYRRRLKQWNRGAYQLMRVALLALAIAAFFWL